jgi:hypothetical protein
MPLLKIALAFAGSLGPLLEIRPIPELVDPFESGKA